MAAMHTPHTAPARRWPACLLALGLALAPLAPTQAAPAKKASATKKAPTKAPKATKGTKGRQASPGNQQRHRRFGGAERLLINR